MGNAESVLYRNIDINELIERKKLENKSVNNILIQSENICHTKNDKNKENHCCSIFNDDV